MLICQYLDITLKTGTMKIFRPEAAGDFGKTLEEKARGGEWRTTSWNYHLYCFNETLEIYLASGNHRRRKTV